MAIKYLDAKRIRGSSTVGAVSTIGTGANGTAVSDPTFVAAGDTNGVAMPSGLGLKSIYVDGNDAINITGAKDFSASSGTIGTISFWYYNTGSQDSKTIMAFGDTNAQQYMRFETRGNASGDNKIVFHNQDGSGGSNNNWEIRNTGTISTSAWHHGVASQNGTTVVCYIDGVELTSWDNQNDKSEWILSGIDNGRIGCSNKGDNGDQDNITGNITEVALWNVALTEEQVQDLWDSGNGKPATTYSTGLRAYYDGSSLDNAAVVVDEKATLITTAGTGWTHAGSNALTSDELQWEIQAADESYYDIQEKIGESVSDTSWVLRFKFATTVAQVGTSTDMGFLGLSSQNAATNVAQEFMGFSFNAYSNYNYDAQATATDNAALEFNQDGNDDPATALIYPEGTWSTSYVKYWEIIRNGNVVTMNVYPDSTYGTAEATFARTQTGITGLRYFLLSGTTGRGSQSQHMAGSVDDIYFWNGVTTAGSNASANWKDSFADSSDLPENTLFDETDTYKTWWLQDGAWAKTAATSGYPEGIGTTGDATFVSGSGSTWARTSGADGKLLGDWGWTNGSTGAYDLVAFGGGSGNASSPFTDTTTGLSGSTTSSDSDEWAICIWVNPISPEAGSNYYFLMNNSETSGMKGFPYWYYNDDNSGQTGSTHQMSVNGYDDSGLEWWSTGYSYPVGGTTSPVVDLTPSEWNLIIVQKEGSKIHAYVGKNGTDANPVKILSSNTLATGKGLMRTLNRHWRIGNYAVPNGYGSRVNGMDEFSFWGRSLSESERNKLFNGGAGKSLNDGDFDQTELRIYFNFEQNPYGTLTNQAIPT